MDYLQEIRCFHDELIKPHKGKPVGCSLKEIEVLEKTIGLPLPDSYKQYLLWMGKDYSGVFQGSNYFLYDVEANSEYLPALLEENNVDFHLPKQYLVFFMHQGYIASWFNLPKENENPTTYYYHEAYHSIPEIRGNFTDVLLMEMKALVP